MTARTLVILALALAPGAAAAQSPASPAAQRPAPAADLALGWAGFADERVVHHTLAGAALRVYVSPRVSLGPEVQFMAGPGADRDLLVTGNVTVDLLAPAGGRPRRLTPFLVAGAGLFRNSNDTGARSYSSTEGGVTMGLGVRGRVSDRVTVGADARLGWEMHVRVAGVIGIALR